MLQIKKHYQNIINNETKKYIGSSSMKRYYLYKAT